MHHTTSMSLAPCAMPPSRMRKPSLSSGKMQRSWISLSVCRRCSMHVDAHVDAGHVEHREDAHGHAELLEYGVDASRRLALEREPQRLARITFHHAITDEPV